MSEHLYVKCKYVATENSDEWTQVHEAEIPTKVIHYIIGSGIAFFRVERDVTDSLSTDSERDSLSERIINRCRRRTGSSRQDKDSGAPDVDTYLKRETLVLPSYSDTETLGCLFNYEGDNVPEIDFIHEHHMDVQIGEETKQVTVPVKVRTYMWNEDNKNNVPHIKNEDNKNNVLGHLRENVKIVPYASILSLAYHYPYALAMTGFDALAFWGGDLSREKEMNSIRTYIQSRNNRTCESMTNNLACLYDLERNQIPGTDLEDKTKKYPFRPFGGLTVHILSAFSDNVNSVRHFPWVGFNHDGDQGIFKKKIFKNYMAGEKNYVPNVALSGNFERMDDSLMFVSEYVPGLFYSEGATEENIKKEVKKKEFWNQLNQTVLKRLLTRAGVAGIAGIASLYGGYVLSRTKPDERVFEPQNVEYLSTAISETITRETLFSIISKTSDFVKNVEYRGDIKQYGHTLIHLDKARSYVLDGDGKMQRSIHESLTTLIEQHGVEDMKKTLGFPMEAGEKKIRSLQSWKKTLSWHVDEFLGIVKDEMSSSINYTWDKSGGVMKNIAVKLLSLQGIVILVLYNLGETIGVQSLPELIQTLMKKMVTKHASRIFGYFESGTTARRLIELYENRADYTDLYEIGKKFLFDENVDSDTQTNGVRHIPAEKRVDEFYAEIEMKGRSQVAVKSNTLATMAVNQALWEMKNDKSKQVWYQSLVDTVWGPPDAPHIFEHFNSRNASSLIHFVKESSASPFNESGDVSPDLADTLKHAQRIYRSSLNIRKLVQKKLDTIQKIPGKEDHIHRISKASYETLRIWSEEIRFGNISENNEIALYTNGSNQTQKAICNIIENTIVLQIDDWNGRYIHEVNSNRSFFCSYLTDNSEGTWNCPVNQFSDELRLILAVLLGLLPTLRRAWGGGVVSKFYLLSLLAMHASAYSEALRFFIVMVLVITPVFKGGSRIIRNTPSLSHSTTT